jgi:hypothetical protein
MLAPVAIVVIRRHCYLPRQLFQLVEHQASLYIAKQNHTRVAGNEYRNLGNVELRGHRDWFAAGHRGIFV